MLLLGNVGRTLDVGDVDFMGWVLKGCLDWIEVF